jgi:hypothetical protein
MLLDDVVAGGFAEIQPVARHVVGIGFAGIAGLDPRPTAVFHCTTPPRIGPMAPASMSALLRR